MAKKDERRVHTRVAADCTIEITTKDGRSFTENLKSLSIAACKIREVDSLKVGDRVQFHLKHRRKDEAGRAEVRGAADVTHLFNDGMVMHFERFTGGDYFVLCDLVMMYIEGRT